MNLLALTNMKIQFPNKLCTKLEMITQIFRNLNIEIYIIHMDISIPKLLTKECLGELKRRKDLLFYQDRIMLEVRKQLLYGVVIVDLIGLISNLDYLYCCRQVYVDLVL